MKYLITMARILVGVLFILSGLIKLNDPLGFSFKLEEYFSPSVLDLPFLEPYALALALFVVVLEVILGVTLLLGFRIGLTLWTLLATIVFFTFLTFYSAYYNKVTDCGCFGDAVKLTPWQSFGKDVALLGLILFLMGGKKHIRPLGTPGFRLVATLVALAACVWFGNHVLNHLPVVDFRPYAVGKSIPEGMAIPEDAPKPVYEYRWKFRVNGQEEIITTLGDYPRVDGEFIGLEGTREVQAGYEPPIHDFTMEMDGQDLAPFLLKRKNLLMVVAYDLAKSNADAFSELSRVADTALARGYAVVGLSASSEADTRALRDTFNLHFPFYFTDMTALKTIVRSNPGVLRLERGTIRQKLHYNDLEELELPPLSEEARFDLPLKKVLEGVMERDQKYRAEPDMESWRKQMALDSANLRTIDSVMAIHGYPGKTLVGAPANQAAWYVIQHSSRIDEFLPQVRIAAETGELPFRLYAMMLDRSLMGRDRPQIYGTQGMSFFTGTPDEISLIWPIEDAGNVNARREQAGFSQTVEAYGKDLFGPGFEYRPFTLEEALEIRAKQNP